MSLFDASKCKNSEYELLSLLKAYVEKHGQWPARMIAFELVSLRNISLIPIVHCHSLCRQGSWGWLESCVKETSERGISRHLGSRTYRSSEQSSSTWRFLNVVTMHDLWCKDEERSNYPPLLQYYHPRDGPRLRSRCEVGILDIFQPMVASHLFARQDYFLRSINHLLVQVLAYLQHGQSFQPGKQISVQKAAKKIKRITCKPSKTPCKDEIDAAAQGFPLLDLGNDILTRTLALLPMADLLKVSSVSFWVLQPLAASRLYCNCTLRLWHHNAFYAKA